jgi:hypothetical protein
MPDHLNVNGIFPHLCLKAELGPPRSECGVGALMPFADRLWAATYLSSKSRSGVGTGLYEIDADLTMVQRPESYCGTYTNRLVHFESNQLFIGPWAIDADRNVRTIEPLLEIRTCSTTRHLTDPENKIYVLGMEGEFFEVDVHTLAVTRLFDLVEELGLREVDEKLYNRPHFKAAHCDYGRVVVANNTYGPPDFRGEVANGRLAEWDGETWTVLEEKPFVEVTGRIGFGGTIFATGWDRASAILEVFTRDDSRWTRYRLPKASHTFDHMWSTEWPRIREIAHERFLMDCHGMFYELFTWAYGNRVWGVRPVSTHLWVLGDFCTYRGALVLGTDDASPSGKSNPLTGEPQSTLWFGKPDDLWQWGKPSGWGGVWWKEPVEGREPSDPFLMTGFDHKVLHLTHDAPQDVYFSVEVDFLGDGTWHPYESILVMPGDYMHHEFPAGFSAHWVRVTASRDCRATAYFAYA